MSRPTSTTKATGAQKGATGWSGLAVIGILTLAAVAAYWNSFNVPFLLDDTSSIGDNPSIRHLGKLADVLSPPASGTTAARPLLNFTLAVNYVWDGLSVRGYHVVNLFIHICAGLALFGVVRRTLILPPLRKRYGAAALPLAAFAALLWTLHPLQTESVTYISQRAESLMGLFFLLTLYGFIRATSPQFSDMGGTPMPRSTGVPPVGLQKTEMHLWLGLSLIACLCGMATKQVMVTAPVLVLLYDRAFVSESFRSALAKRRWYYAGLAASWLLLGFLMQRSSQAAVGVGFQSRVSWPTYALTELHVVADYLKLAFWPHPLVFDYGSEILATNPLAVLPYAAIVVAVLAGVAIAWRRSPMAGFLGGWFFLILAPTSTVVPISEQPMAESRVYLPLAAVAVLVTLLGYALGHRKAIVVLGIVAAGLGALTIQRNLDYRSELSIWEDTVARQPQSSRGHSSFGVALAGIPGRVPEAIAHFEEALRLKPDNVEAHNSFGIALAKMPGRLPDAIAHFEAALRLKPHYAQAHNSLGIALAEMPGRLPDAIAHYQEALRLNPNQAEVYNNLGVALAKVPGRAREATACYEKALRLKPDYAEPHYNLANALAKLPGRLPEVIAHYEEALRLKPDYAEAHYNFAIALAKIPGRMPDAIAHNEEAVRLKPDFVDARNNLAIGYAETGRLEAAIGQLEIAARLNPASTAIRGNLEALKTRRRQ
jgi:protein O-mannosyl-transferase